MNFNNFTLKAQEAIQAAVELAASHQQQAIEPGHILKALVLSDDAVVPFVLKKLNINLNFLSQKADDLIATYPKIVSSSDGTYFSNDTTKLIEAAKSKLKPMGDEFVAIEHLLLGMLDAGAKAGQLLKDQGISEKDVLKVIQELRGDVKVTDANAESKYNALSRFAQNLTELARDGKLDPCIGRDEEIRRVMQILSRRTKNNPVLIGEPGVGKTAIAEGLAQRIIQGDVPENLKNKMLVSLDMAALLAGAKYMGEFEERLKSVVNEVIRSEGQVILFIDEIHTLVGAGRSDGAMDAANILKPALARGELRSIGATTLAEYQKYIEKDKALERRFQPIVVDEPNAEDAISILRGIKEKYELHHGVKITDGAIISAVELSQRYITDRFLPDKAIDLMDEASAKLRLEMDSLPEELDELERRIRQLEIEREAIRREKDEKKITELSEQIENLSEQRDNLRAQWKLEKDLIQQIRNCQEGAEQLRIEADRAERNADWGLAAEIRYGRVVDLEKRMVNLKTELESMGHGKRLLSEEVDSQKITDIVARWTGIPVSRMLESEREKLLRMESELHQRVVGQQDAITAVSNAIRRNRAGLSDPRKPIGSFVFIGSTGVGKTELARGLAEYLFNDENAMVRIDMSEYQEKHAVSRLIGAPPGYVGYDEGGQLTEAIRRRPYSVVLLDEIEKAHPDVFNTLLQVLDEGRLTDNKGRTANFRNTIIIMTSNLGAHLIQQRLEQFDENNRDEIMAKVRLDVYNLLKATLPPEFLNRIDETILFTPLNREEIRQIVELQLKSLKDMLAEREFQIEFTEAALDWLAQLGYDPQYGARPLKRVIQRKVIDELARMILANEIDKEQIINVDINDKNQVVFRNYALNPN